MTFDRLRRRAAPGPRSWLRLALAGAALLASASALSTPPASFSHGEGVLRAPLDARDCISCHAREVDGSVLRMSLRSARRMRAPAPLFAQPDYCSAELGMGSFPEEQEHIAAYLNKQYYRFE